MNAHSRCLIAFSAAVLVSASGCHMYRAPGAMLPSFAAAAEDRSIEQHASTSSFPSPDEVGLSDSDEEEQE
ncbi:hypothetical protein NG895_26730 [Aeoliella sp. ICT_H6.2]|uniref:Lipoprotein n=1 Tax=Aeoliella straminimaris TaxID=2954799 RepID=A0A9X2JIW1_9BACT|nr:hypothetical protein [Aeoliella straminimaris]MCO6047515.1 hypothetical protein [Aeoliella straminimaris]